MCGKDTGIAGLSWAEGMEERPEEEDWTTQEMSGVRRVRILPLAGEVVRRERCRRRIGLNLDGAWKTEQTLNSEMASRYRREESSETTDGVSESEYWKYV